ncbi:dipeptide/oligopeptide/nickel ABC transporter ATP-binding protein [Chitinispirillales bacterium ANBcel5]|uniref:ABC transporter ATP-binding protein n=1 Tax=Cellulosispirillum alkaliphilum TaxID=3039283 RepID=UPI002A51F37A|nr:dipeptide/oligopeptide/nickel ABC transporter ATP-binding protein [Chitinispirillales bacterium ANBcel5]
MPVETDIFNAQNVTCVFGHGKKRVTAVDDVTFKICDQEIVSLVGGSGCGKSVLAKLMLSLHKPTSGVFLYKGKVIEDQKEHWREVQPVFQDPFSCFNQFFTIRSQLKDSFGIIKEKPSKKEIEERVDQALLAVNIKPHEIEGKYPFELSGGQMQRMLLARIFILRPKVLIADEPTSMVDACVRANILDYLMKLKEELKMTIVFITHDIGLAYYVSDRLFIMHKGKIVEQGSPDDVTQRPQSDHTKQLLSDIPDIHREWITA